MESGNLAASLSKGASEEFQSSGMSSTKILLVDDFLPWQRLVREILASEADLNITCFAGNGFEAVQKAQESQPDLILMDISLPVMDGLDAAHEIRRLLPRSKIVFVSEHRGSDIIQAAFDAGGSGYVLKSDSDSDLVPALRAALREEQFVSHSLKDWREGSRSED